ncbi:DUF501 domain-containing protein [Marinospirillum alkaliphilum]|uniref:DUF501 domain-containing protein n=1 Tax=Marinospirillum alkaliphilum DSM 21637 TaxID=1122209 RepID=A0A1K1V041_9GAMM|nr:DUF501 domain-containing protein [Marinospirillum alkaliphilum]SFX18466.1 hypothetical protein SAMN02745752_00705 [Marinospirillum alkaliphilum DSM 21637]
MFHRVSLLPTTEQRAAIATELGKEPKGMQQITAVDGQGHPLAVQVAALVDDKPFPTFYWLTSRFLVKELSHLEAAGLIKQLEDRLQEDPQLMAAYQRSHEDYVARRWAAMSDAMRQRIRELGYESVFSQRGVGGIENWQQVRCLHTQYAHHLSSGQGNAIGQLLDDEYGIAGLLP